MKKLLTLSLIAFFVLSSAKVFAQAPSYSTGEYPFVGATHNYWVNSTSLTDPDSHTGASYNWSVITSDGTTPAVQGTDCNFTASTDHTQSITWLKSGTYYVLVTETLAGCENTKAFEVTVRSSAFYLALSAPTNACYTNSVNVKLTSGAITYNHGYTEVTYKIDATGVDGTEGWSFDLNPQALPTNISQVVANSAISIGDDATIDASNHVVVNSGISVSVTLRYNNANDYASNAAPSAQDFDATVTITNGKTAKGVDDNGTDGTYQVTTTVARPNTSVINHD